MKTRFPPPGSMRRWDPPPGVAATAPSRGRRCSFRVSPARRRLTHRANHALELACGGEQRPFRIVEPVGHVGSAAAAVAVAHGGDGGGGGVGGGGGGGGGRGGGWVGGPAGGVLFLGARGGGGGVGRFPPRT